MIKVKWVSVFKMQCKVNRNFFSSCQTLNLHKQVQVLAYQVHSILQYVTITLEVYQVCA